MKEMDLPETYQVYDRSALRAQRSHFRLVAGEIVVILFIASAITLDSYSSFESYTDEFVILVLSAFFAVIILRLFIMTGSWEPKWYAFRSVAESSKKLAWSYIMKVGDFAADEVTAKDSLARALQGLQAGCKFSPEAKEEGSRNWESVTSEMARLRGASLPDKTTRYLRERLEDQISWYKGQAAMNQARERLMSVILLTLLLVGVSLSAVFLAQRLPTVSVIGLVVTLVAGSIAWSQAKQYAGLVEPYQLTARELGSLRTKFDTIRTEGELAILVAECESSISREHASWVAQRVFTVLPRGP